MCGAIKTYESACHAGSRRQQQSDADARGDTYGGIGANAESSGGYGGGDNNWDKLGQGAGGDLEFRGGPFGDRERDERLGLR